MVTRQINPKLFLVLLLISTFVGSTQTRAESGNHEKPSFDHLIGQEGYCYRPVHLGESDTGSSRVLTVERKLRAASNFQEVALMKVGMAGELSSEIVISNLPEKDFHIAGAVALNESIFVLTGSTAGGILVASADSMGKVIKTKTLGGAYELRGLIRISSEKFLIYGAKSGKPFFAIVNRDFNVLKEQQINTKKTFGTIVRAEYDQVERNLMIAVQSTNDVSFAQTEINIVRIDLSGKVGATYVVPGFLGDFVRTSGGIGVVYYEGNQNRQKISLDFLNSNFKKKWHREVVDAQYGVIWPRVASPDNKELLVIAGHGLRLYMTAFNPAGEKPWSYWESSAVMTPAFGYLVAAEDGKLLLLQEARDSTEKYISAATVCNRVRVLGF